ncbi:putative membrane protein [Ruminiclostridium sufflavum DSM 19573]|uniref:Putative membrane protein n=1 Tax=Ruminiclostridium sufflavum DSM 19573 TaxID=1121337 RepID=A0A318Y0H9_9FIRM|nr:ECF transporter S component [Ruminiclostridium sufflavum]PYG88814.1 putative membrane protein [Ruminiclostridium sufflavum DSM 19573]
MSKVSTRTLVINALMIALVFLITFLPFLHIPSPVVQGYFNIGDAVIMITAMLLGRKSGFVAGAFGSALADLVLGSFVFVPVTFVVKGLEGYMVGLIANKSNNDTTSVIRRLLSLAAGVLVMASGYFMLELSVVRFLDENLALTVIITELPGNLVQGVVSAVLAYVFITIINRTNVIYKLK